MSSFRCEVRWTTGAAEVELPFTRRVPIVRPAQHGEVLVVIVVLRIRPIASTQRWRKFGRLAHAPTYSLCITPSSTARAPHPPRTRARRTQSPGWRAWTGPTSGRPSRATPNEPTHDERGHEEGEQDEAGLRVRALPLGPSHGHASRAHG